MKGLEVQIYLIGYIIANAFALVLLFFAWKFVRLARLFFCVLFAWACWVNWRTALYTPQDYLGYADLAFFGIYKQFILGWFSRHIVVMVGFIATCQGLIAISLLLKGWIYKAGITGAMVFLLAISPFGVGSGFPCTLIMAYALYLLLKEKPNYIWHQPNKRKVMTLS